MIEANNQIAKIRKDRGLSQQQLAEMLGVHWVTISKLERGKIELTQSWMGRLAKVLNVDDLAILRPEREIAAMKLSGTVRENGDIYLGDTENLGFLGRMHITHDFFESPVASWIAVQGETLAPLFNHGDYIRLRWLDAQQQPDAVARLCYVEPEDGKARIGYLQYGSKTGLWTVNVLNGPTLRDQAVKRIAHVSAAAFAMPFPGDEDE